MKKAASIQQLGENALIFKNEKRQLGLMSYNGEVILPAEHKEIDLYDNFAFLPETRELIWLDGTPLLPFNVFRVIPYKGYYKILAKAGMGIINSKGQQIIPLKYTRLEIYNTQFWRGEKKDRKIDLFTLEGRKLNKKSFTTIRAITPKTLIVRNNDMDFLYTDRIQKSFSFQNIQPISNTRYLLTEKHQYGLFSAEGKAIVPVRYHHLTVKSDHFRVSFFNSFGYYTKDGKSISDPR